MSIQNMKEMFSLAQISNGYTLSIQANNPSKFFLFLFIVNMIAFESKYAMHVLCIAMHSRKVIHVFSIYFLSVCIVFATNLSPLQYVCLMLH